MKSYKKLSYMLIAAIALFSACKKMEPAYQKQTDSKDGANVYIARATGNTQNLLIFPYQDQARSFEFSAAFGALGLPASPINVKFVVDDKAFDSLNVSRVAQGLTPFQKFPADAYKISKLSATIPAGQLNSERIKVDYFSKKFNDKVDYLLPISIVNADGYNIGSSKTIFILAPKLSEILATKTGWTTTASSEELVGEGAANGRANFAIDGNVSTYWHSKWQSPAPVFPHWIAIDMQSEIFVTRIELLARQNNNAGFTIFDLEASKDGISWTAVGSNLTLDPVNKSPQSYAITPEFWRYVKVIAKSAGSPTTTSTHLAEINVYRY